MRGSMRNALHFAVIMLVSFAPLARTQNRVVIGVKTQTSPALLRIQMLEPSGPAVLTTELLSVGTLIFLFCRRNP
jgi:hypothetical protein